MEKQGMGFDAKSLIHIAALTFTGCVTASKLDNGSKSIGGEMDLWVHYRVSSVQVN